MTEEFTASLRLEPPELGHIVNIADEVAAPAARSLAKSVARGIEKHVESKICEKLLGAYPSSRVYAATVYVTVDVAVVVKHIGSGG